MGISNLYEIYPWKYERQVPLVVKQGVGFAMSSTMHMHAYPARRTI